MKKAIDVNILGQTIRIKHEDEDYVRQLENYINEKVESLPLQQGVSNLQVALRLLLIIVDDYFSVVKEKEDIHKDIDIKARKMIDFIEQKAALLEEG